MYEVKPCPFPIETNIDDAIFNFFVYGFSPGSYTSHMFMHNFERAKLSAHPHLLTKTVHGVSPHDVYEFIFRNLPEFLVKESFETWPGWLNTTKEKRKEIRNSYTPEKVNEFRTYRILNDLDSRTFKVWIKKADELLKNLKRQELYHGHL